MDICITHSYFYPFQGGIEKQIYEYIKRIEKKGFNVKILAPIPKKDIKRLEEFPYGECFPVPAKMLTLPSVYPPIPVFSPVELRKIFKEEFCNDGVIVQFYLEYYAPLLADLKKNCKFVHSQQCTLAFSEIPQPYEYLYKIVTGNFLFKRFFDNCDIILPISDFIKNSLSQLYHVSEQKMSVMPNAVDCNKVKFSKRGRERFREENDIDGLFIFSAGRLIKEKGFHYLISAISRMEEKDDIILGIAGEGYFDKNLIRLAKSLDVNLKLFGFLKGQNLYDAFSASDVFVTPSIWDEAFGIVNIEAMACERPVIASKSGGIPEVIADNRTGLLYDRFDLDQLVDKLNILTDDSSLRKKMGREGRKRVNKHYSWDILTEEWIKVYSSLN